MWCPRRALPQRSTLLIQLEPSPLEVLDHPLGELVAGIVWGMLSKQPAEQVAAPGKGEADRKHQVIAERPWMHAGDLCS